MEDIGCHFKFETIKGDTFHKTNLLLSSGRNCLRYIIKERGIKKIYIPYFFKIIKLSSSIKKYLKNYMEQMKLLKLKKIHLYDF